MSRYAGRQTYYHAAIMIPNLLQTNQIVSTCGLIRSAGCISVYVYIGASFVPPPPLPPLPSSLCLLTQICSPHPTILTLLPLSLKTNYYCSPLFSRTLLDQVLPCISSFPPPCLSFLVHGLSSLMPGYWIEKCGSA